MRIFAMAILGVFLAARGASGAVLWDESVSSDLSNDWATPTTGGTITNGTYFITGTIGPSDLVDAVSFVVPQGATLTTFIVRSFPPGSSFSSAPFSLRRGPGDFSEVIEFGNFPSLAPPGIDLLQFSSVPGPQGPGIYALSVGHPSLALPETRSYQVEFTVAAVPEPSTASLLLLAIALLWLGLMVHWSHLARRHGVTHRHVVRSCLLLGAYSQSRKSAFAETGWNWGRLLLPWCSGRREDVTMHLPRSTLELEHE